MLSGDGSISADFRLPDEHVAMVKRQELLFCDFNFEEGEPFEGPGSEGPITADEDALPAPERINMAERAEMVSLQEFEESAASSVAKIPLSWEKKGVNSFTRVREKLGYKPLEPTSRELIYGPGRKGFSSLGLAGGAAAAALWATGIVEAFVRNTTALDKAASFLAILPFVGCAVSTAAALEKGDDRNLDLTVVDAVLCGVADALLFGPLAPFGFALHFVRAVISFFRRPPQPPTLEQLQEKRDESWTQQLVRIYQSIYSHPYIDSTQDFAVKMESAFAIDTLSVLSESARTIGLLNATGSPDLFTNLDPDLDLDELQVRTEQAINKIKQDRWDVVARRQREYLFDVLDQFTRGTAFRLTDLAKAVNDKFVEHINSDEFIENYPDQSPVEEFFDAITTESLGPVDRYSKARAQMKAVGERLAESLPPMPQALNVAFIIGQSKGMTHARPDSLSSFSYFEVEMAEASSEVIPGLYRFYVMVRHTHQVVLFLQGRLKEQDMDNSNWPVDDLDTLKKFRLLIAMKLGNYTAPPLIVNPYIPPIEQHPDHNYLVSLAIGLVGAVSSKDLNDEVTEYLETQTSNIRLQNWQALQERIKAIKAKLDELAEEEYKGAPLSSVEFLSKHTPTCVDHGANEEECKIIVGGCFYAHNTTDEFALECIQETFLPLDEARQKTQTQYEDLRNLFPNYREFGLALSKCVRSNPKSRIRVAYACAARAAPKPDDSGAVATTESTS
ncbi:hypothetical protein J3458_022190 [Metarhizium acridum]|uniref:uncharacterized protein n=1 Tax=Metarhizium acridum TaxID=92637 RepID=UPI001C6AE638|nr:hypothetical protein J3458_022190 [Metarhizium acridum]